MMLSSIHGGLYTCTTDSGVQLCLHAYAGICRDMFSSKSGGHSLFWLAVVVFHQDLCQRSLSYIKSEMSKQ